MSTPPPKNADHSKRDEIKTKEGISVIQDALDGIIFPDGTFKERRVRARTLYDAAVATGRPDGTFLKGLWLYKFKGLRAFEYFLKAEKDGSTHPFLYYFLAECYYKGDTARKDPFKARLYYSKAIKAGLELGHVGIYKLYCNDLMGSAARFGSGAAGGLYYLLSLEKQGDAHGSALEALGDAYLHGKGCERAVTKAKEYYERSASLGWYGGLAGLYRLYSQKTSPIFDMNKADMVLFGGWYWDKCDDRIYDLMLRRVDSSEYSSDTKERHAQVQQLIKSTLVRCDSLINDGSSKGYIWKDLTLNTYGKDHVSAMYSRKSWLEIDAKGFATWRTYTNYVMTNDMMKNDGKKAAECLLKAVDLAIDNDQQIKAYKLLAEVYGKGAPGLKKDDFAAFEYGTRASFAGDEEHVDLSFRKIHIEL